MVQLCSALLLIAIIAMLCTVFSQISQVNECAWISVQKNSNQISKDWFKKNFKAKSSCSDYVNG